MARTKYKVLRFSKKGGDATVAFGLSKIEALETADREDRMNPGCHHYIEREQPFLRR